VGVVDVQGSRLVVTGRRNLARVVERDVVDARVRVERGGRPVATTQIGRAVFDGNADFIENHIFVDGHDAFFVDAFDHVRVGGIACPQEFAGFGIELPHGAGLARHAGQDAAAFTRSIGPDGTQAV